MHQLKAALHKHRDDSKKVGMIWGRFILCGADSGMTQLIAGGYKMHFGAVDLLRAAVMESSIGRKNRWKISIFLKRLQPFGVIFPGLISFVCS